MAKELISAYDFAKRKNVSNTIIYRRMHLLKTIDYVKIGQTKYINWDKYKDMEFNEKKTGKRND